MTDTSNRDNQGFRSDTEDLRNLIVASDEDVSPGHSTVEGSGLSKTAIAETLVELPAVDEENLETDTTRLDLVAVTEFPEEPVEADAEERTLITPMKQALEGLEMGEDFITENTPEPHGNESDVGASGEMIDTSVTPESKAITKVVAPVEPYGSDTLERKASVVHEARDEDNESAQAKVLGSASSTTFSEDTEAGIPTGADDDVEKTTIVHQQIPEPRVPEQKIAGYDIVDVLGRGGMGTVYRAFSSSMRKIVALKVVRKGRGPVVEERFDREIRFLHRLSHPNVCSVYDSGVTEKGDRYLVMDYVDGTVLETLLRVSPPSARKLAEILADVADGLAHAHEQGIIHRDVKPENIILNSAGVPVLVDFGIAMDEQGGGSRLTGAGRSLGTPTYMAPEQVLGLHEQIGSQTDMFGLGVVFFEGVCGGVPFVGNSDLETLRKIVHDPLPVLKDRTGRPLSKDIADVLTRCLAKKPNQRFKSMESLVEALRGISEPSVDGQDEITVVNVESVDAASDSVAGSMELADLSGADSGSQIVAYKLGAAALFAALFEAVRGGSFWGWLALTALLTFFSMASELPLERIKARFRKPSWEMDEDDLEP